MTRAWSAVVALVCLLAAGCAAGPRTAAVGSAPAGPDPQDLQGKLRGPVYEAADGTFSVATPFPPGSPEFGDLEIKELYGAEDSYVSFAPGNGRDVYRVDVSRTHTPSHLGVPLEVVAPLLVRVYADQLEHIYGTALVQQRHETVEVAGHRAEFWAYTQRIPADKIDGGDGRDVIETDYVYVVDGGDEVATLWAEVPEPCGHCGQAERAAQPAQYRSVDRFVRSFAFGTAPAGTATP
jgi:hypothetical protein